MTKPYLLQFYQNQVAPDLKKNRGHANVHQIPRIEKIVLNTGFSSDFDKAQIEDASKEMGLIAGQKPVINKARKSVSNFKLREGMPIGAKVTLRGHSMWEFLYRLISVALPGIRDFRGVPDKFDGNGNYTLGIADNTIFPEVQHDGSKKTYGMDVCIVTSATTDDEGRELLAMLGIPFRKRNVSPTATKA